MFLERRNEVAADYGALIADEIITPRKVIKRSIAAKVMERLPETMIYIEDYARDTMDVRRLLIDKMQQLDETQFEALIRPAFEQDEWILITVGAVLGFVMGEAQALVLEHFASR